MVDFINLTRGLMCCEVENPHYLRIQSTWCEQKRWEDVLATVGPDFLYHLAVGEPIRVHDVSERMRMTRACWQGLTWIRFACERLWGAVETPAIARGGVNATRYFEEELVKISPRVKKQVEYFGGFYRGKPLDYDICWEW